MSSIYTRADLKTSINELINNRKDMITDFNTLINESVRVANGMFDSRSTRRKSDLSPALFNGVFRYAAPSDLKKDRIIDIEAQIKVEQSQRYFLVPTEEFYRLRHRKDGAIAIDDYNDTKTLLISSNINSKAIVVSPLDSLTSGGGTWVAFGDAENLTVDNDNYIAGISSLNFDISSAGGTTAGIENTGLDQFDLDDNYLGGNSALFVWAYLSSSTNVTNFVLRIGSDSSNYHSKTVTTAHNSAAFADGWNLLKFDLTSLTDTGTPDDDNIDYMAIYMTKDASKVSETDYRFDNIVIRKGEINSVKYYSNYPWKNTSGTYLRNSTNDADILLAAEEEYEIHVKHGEYRALKVLREHELAAIAKAEFEEKVKAYKLEYPSEAMLMSMEYYTY